MTNGLHLTAFFLLALIGLMGLSPASANALSPPNWTAIFAPDGAVANLNGGLEAVFLEDDISAGVAVDMSVLADPNDPSVVSNGIVAPAQDLGNAYVWMTADDTGSWLLYAGVERFSSTIDTFVKFEFNQAVVQVTDGVPWRITGGREPGDLLIQVDFRSGQLGSTEFERWDGASYQTVATTVGDSCGAGDYGSCSGSPPMPHIEAEAWDQAGNPVQTPDPDSFVQFGVNLGALLGANPEFTSIRITSPQDILLGAFRHIGVWKDGATKPVNPAP